MGKYDSLKFLVKRKARTAHVCAKCGGSIGPRDHYFAESLGQVRPGPGVILNSYCLECGPTAGMKVSA